MNHSLHNTFRASAVAAALSLLSVITCAQAAGNGAADPVALAMNATGSLAVKGAGPYVEIGSFRIWVSSHLGKPRHILADGSWVYQGFAVDNSDIHGALLVSFKQGRVSDLRLVSPAVLTAMLSAPKSAAKTLIANR